MSREVLLYFERPLEKFGETASVSQNAIKKTLVAIIEDMHEDFKKRRINKYHTFDQWPFKNL